jgi:hypothetical protein
MHYNGLVCFSEKLTSRDFAQHDDSVSLHNGDAAQTFWCASYVENGTNFVVAWFAKIPSHALNVSTTNGCVGSNTHSATSLALIDGGFSILALPVSLPIFQLIFVILTGARPVRTKPIGV